MGVDVGRGRKWGEREAEVVAVAVDDVELVCMRIGVANVQVLGEPPVPQPFVVHVPALEVVAKLGGSPGVAGREQSHVVAARHELIAQQRDELLDRLARLAVCRSPEWRGLGDPKWAWARTL